MARNLIDTSSLVSLALYHIPFDGTLRLLRHVENKFKAGEWLLLKSVREELKKQRGGNIAQVYPFLKQIQLTRSAVDATHPPSPTQLERIRDDWTDPERAKKLKAEYRKEQISILTRRHLRQFFQSKSQPSQTYNELTASIQREAEKEVKSLYSNSHNAELLALLNKADFQLILTAKKLIASSPLLPDPVAIVTEETPWSNDGKLFKKIPAICDKKIENITCITLTDLLKNSGIPLYM